MKKKLSIIFSVNIADDEGALFVQPGKRYPAAETEIDRVTMVRIKAGTKLEQPVHKDRQTEPFVDTTSNYCDYSQYQQQQQQNK